MLTKIQLNQPSTPNKINSRQNTQQNYQPKVNLSSMNDSVSFGNRMSAFEELMSHLKIEPRKATEAAKDAVGKAIEYIEIKGPHSPLKVPTGKFNSYDMELLKNLEKEGGMKFDSMIDDSYYIGTHYKDLIKANLNGEELTVATHDQAVTNIPERFATLLDEGKTLEQNLGKKNNNYNAALRAIRSGEFKAGRFAKNEFKKYQKIIDEMKEIMTTASDEHNYRLVRSALLNHRDMKALTPEEARKISRLFDHGYTTRAIGGPGDYDCIVESGAKSISSPTRVASFKQAVKELYPEIEHYYTKS